MGQHHSWFRLDRGPQCFINSSVMFRPFVEKSEPREINLPIAAEWLPDFNDLLNCMWARISSGVKPLIDSPVKGMYTIRLISLQDVSDHLRLNINQKRLSKIFFSPKLRYQLILNKTHPVGLFWSKQNEVWFVTFSCRKTPRTFRASIAPSLAN